MDHQVRTALEGLFTADPPKDFVRLVRKRLPSLRPVDVRASLERALVTIDYPVPLAGSEHHEEPRPTEPPEAGTDEGPSRRPGAKTPLRHVTLLDLIAHGLITPPLDIETRYKGRTL